MCYDLNEYDPFEPYDWDYNEYEEWVYYSYPMSDEDWEEWLSTMENEE